MIHEITPQITQDTQSCFRHNLINEKKGENISVLRDISLPRTINQSLNKNTVYMQFWNYKDNFPSVTHA